MADEKISLLPAAGTLDGSEPVPVVKGGVTKQTTTQEIADLATIPTQQQVSDAGNTTTTEIRSSDGASNRTAVGNGYVDITTGGGGVVKVNSAPATQDYTAQLPDKAANAVETFAMLSDITGGGGDVDGPASAVDSNVVFFDGTTGKIIKDSGLSLSGTNTGDETVSTLGATINGAAAATPNDTDLVATVESSVVKKITWTNVKAFLKTYFDTLYTTTSAVATQITTALSGYLTAATAATTYSKKALTQIGGGTTITGVAGNTYSNGLLVPADTRGTGDIPRILVRVNKTGSANTAVLRVYINTTNDIAGSPILIGTYSAAAATRTFGFMRNPVIEVGAGTGNGTILVDPTLITLVNDAAVANNVVSNVALVWTADRYIVCSLQLAGAADTAVVQSILLD